MTIRTRMKWINSIFIMLLVFSCKIDNKKLRQPDLADNDSITPVLYKAKNQVSSEKNERNVILGTFQFKLGTTDPKFVYLKTLINTKNINKEVKSGKSNEVEYFTTYLGQIKQGDVESHMFKQFYTIQAAIAKHGHSVIVFLNKNDASYYDMEMPENLSLDLKNGSFRYKYKNDTLNMKIEHISEYDLILRNTYMMH